MISAIPFPRGGPFPQRSARSVLRCSAFKMPRPRSCRVVNHGLRRFGVAVDKELDTRRRSTFAQLANCFDTALMERGRSAKIELDCRCVAHQKQRGDFLEAFRMAAVEKIGCAWQHWHRSQTLKVTTCSSSFRRRSFSPMEHEGSLATRRLQVGSGASKAEVNRFHGGSDFGFRLGFRRAPCLTLMVAAEMSLVQACRSGVEILPYTISRMTFLIAGIATTDGEIYSGLQMCSAQQKQRTYFLEVFRTADVAKMRCALQQWHRPQTLRVSV